MMSEEINLDEFLTNISTRMSEMAERHEAARREAITAVTRRAIGTVLPISLEENSSDYCLSCNELFSECICNENTSNRCDDCDELLDDCECGNDNEQEEKSITPKPFNKGTFLHSLSPSKELSLILAPLEEKEAVLKAVFEYYNKPKKIALRRTSQKAVAFVKEHNALVEQAYINRLHNFYIGAMEAFNKGTVGAFVSDQLPIVKDKTIDETIFTHQLFKVTAIGNHKTSQWGRVKHHGLRLKVTTREEVWYTFEGYRLNFGRLSFNIFLDEHKVTFQHTLGNFCGNACPYISHNRVCLGENSYSFGQKLKEGRLSEALTELYTTMTRFNTEGTPYRGLDRFFESAHKGSLRYSSGKLAVLERL
jgi:hypothetical protein